MLKRGLLSLLIVCFAPAFTQGDRPLIVPDKYPTIQQAVDAAEPWDTIIVREGTYTESVTVDKRHLTVKSEKGPETTIVNPLNLADDSAIFSVHAESVHITGFTIQNNTYGSGIRLDGALDCSIAETIVLNNKCGMCFRSQSNSNVIFNNTVRFNKEHGLLLENSCNNTVTDNDISNNRTGITVFCSFDANTAPLRSSINIVRYNRIAQNDVGLTLFRSSGNVVYLNDFLDNRLACIISSRLSTCWHTPTKRSYTCERVSVREFFGNYWSDYAGQDTNKDRIGDVPYLIDPDKDSYPLMKPVQDMGVFLFTDWQTQDEAITGIASADLDADGTKEIVVSTQEDIVAYIFDGFKCVEVWREPRYAADSIAIGDLNGDGSKEIVLGARDDYAGKSVCVLDGRTREMIWRSEKIRQQIKSLRIGDVDGDGTAEITAGTADSGVLKAAHVYVFDGVGYSQEWVSQDLKGGIRLDVGDANGDGISEIVCGTRDGFVYVFDGASRREAFKSSDLGGNVRGVVIDDLDGDGVSEITVSNAEGDICVFDGISYAEKKRWKRPRTGWISSLAVDDIDNDGQKEIVAGLMVGERLPAYGTGYVYVLDGATLALERESEAVAQWIGLSGIVIDDLDNDGQKEIITAGKGRIYIFSP